MTDLEILVIGLLIGLSLGWCGRSARIQDSEKRRVRRMIRRSRHGRKNWQD